MISEHEIIKVKIADLVFDDTNPNQMSQEQMQGLRKSMERFGYLTPIVIDQDNKIADGEHRVLVYKEHKKDEIPAIRYHFSDDVERRIMRQTMNKLHGEHHVIKDAEELAIIYEANRFSDLSSLVAKKEETLKEFMLTYKPGLPLNHESDEQIDRIIDEQLSRTVPDTQLGDLYQLGPHRLICGDCSDHRILATLLEDKEPDMIFTDPPYDMDIQTLEQIFLSYRNFSALQFWMLGDMQAIHLCHKTDSFAKFFIHDFVTPTIINNKMAMTQHTLIAQFGKRAMRNLYDGFSSIIKVNTLRGFTEHKEFRMGKRPELPGAFISHFANPGGIILDIFGGAGSTLMAAEKCGFPCYMIEMDPRYCDIIKRRYEAYSREPAKHLNRA
jgi:16S rRNA G966 N2-methylase RsmD